VQLHISYDKNILKGRLLMKKSIKHFIVFVSVIILGLSGVLLAEGERNGGYFEYEAPGFYEPEVGTFSSFATDGILWGDIGSVNRSMKKG